MLTEGAYLIEQRDKHIRMAIRKSRKHDTTGVQMHMNIAQGICLRLEKMTSEELEAAHE